MCHGKEFFRKRQYLQPDYAAGESCTFTHCTVYHPASPRGETDGREYVFTDETHVQQLESAGKVIELRAYHTVYGIWKYFTVDDGRIDLSAHSYLYIVTLEGYQKIQRYFGSSRVVPIYIEVEDGERLLRAIARSGSRKLRSMRKCAGDFLRMQPIFPRKS